MTDATKPLVSIGAKIEGARFDLARARAMAHSIYLMAPQVAAESTDDEEALREVSMTLVHKIGRVEDLLKTIDL